MRMKLRFAAHAAIMWARFRGASFQTLRRAESRNPVILLDELDKVGADFRGSAAALSKSIDPAQNSIVHRSLPRFAFRPIPCFCSSPPANCWTLSTLPFAIDSKSSTSPATPAGGNCKSPSVTSSRGNWKKHGPLAKGP